MTDEFTDWLANCNRGYGVGYTREQALAEMVKHIHPKEDEEVTIDLFEHTGNFTVSALSVQFEGDVHTHQRVEVDGEYLKDIGERALGVESRVSNVLMDAEEIED